MLKLPNLTWHIQTGSVNIGGAVQQATNALLAGVCKYAVVWRAMHNPRGTYQNLPGTFAQGPLQFTAPYGFGGPGQHMAVAYTRWLEKNNQNREKMATLAVTQRKHGLKNSHSYFKVPLTREEYLSSRMVAYPFCLYDCDIPVQGAVAIVLTTADRARDLKPRPAYLAGYGQRLHFEVAGRIGSLSSYMDGGRSSAQLTWERSGFTPKDVDVAQIYDGFSASVLYGLNCTDFARKAKDSISSRTDAWSSTANYRSTLSAAVSARGASMGSGISSKACCKRPDRRQASGKRCERFVCRGERAYRAGHNVHLRQRTLLIEGKYASRKESHVLEI